MIVSGVMLPACCCRWCTTPRWWADNQAVIVSGVMLACLSVPVPLLLLDADAVDYQSNLNFGLAI